MSDSDFKRHDDDLRVVANFPEREEDFEGCVQVDCVKGCCTAKGFLTVLCLYSVLQSMVASGFIPASVTALERRYDLSSFQLGFLSAIYDLSIVCVVSLISYYGGKGHTPRWLAVSMCSFMTGCFLFASPHYGGGEYTFTGSTEDAQLCDSSNLPWDTSCDADSSAYALLCLGILFLSWASAALYTLAPPYLDKIVNATTSAKYLGTFYAMSAVGPALGYMLDTFLLAQWVDGGEPPNGIDDEHPKWVGMWWVGFTLAGCLAIFVIIPMCLFPKWKSFPERDDHDNHNDNNNNGINDSKRTTFDNIRRRSSTLQPVAVPLDQDSMDVKEIVKSLFSNKAWLFNSLGTAAETFAVSGFSYFLVKVVGNQFSLTASNAALYVGVTIVPGVAGGIYAGGALLKWRNPSGKGIAKMAFLIAAFATGCMLLLLIGCTATPFAGVTEAYTNNNDNLYPFELYSPNLDATCNTNCACDDAVYTPVCGSDGIRYFSPCYAGCNISSTNGDIFNNCNCFGEGQATLGKCDGDCPLAAFLFCLFITMFVTFLNNVPATTVVLRCVPEHHRTFGMGLRDMMLRALGAVPGPLIFGVILDELCILWENKCGEEGSCFEYEGDSVQLTLVSMAFLPKTLSAIFFYLSYRYYEEDESAYEETDVPEGNVQNSVINNPDI